MSFSDKLLLWLHLGFAIFAIGPVTAVTSVAPRYIRAKDVAVLRYLRRATRLFGTLSLGVLLFGALLGRAQLAKPYLSISTALFVVAIILLLIIDRDLGSAVRVLSSESSDDDARVQTGRIAMLGGITALLWLVILVLMVFFP